MANVFDPYHKWLGISSDERPPNHYRLLGIAQFESDEDVIQNGADQRMAHIRSFQSGPHGRAAEKILSQLAQASRCLLDRESRAGYDAQLRASLRVVEPKLTPHQLTKPGAVRLDQRKPKRRRPALAPSVHEPSGAVEPQPAALPIDLRPAISQNHADVPLRNRTPRQTKLGLGPQILGIVAFGIGGLFIGSLILAVFRSAGTDDASRNTAAGRETRSTKSKQGEKPRKKKPRRSRSASARSTDKQANEKLPPLSEFAGNSQPAATKPSSGSAEREPQLSAQTRETFAVWMRDAETAIRANRRAKAREVLERYVRYGDAPERGRAENLLQQCRYADISLEDASQLLSQMSADDLRALQHGTLEISIHNFDFTHPNLRQAFYDRLRQHLANVLQNPTPQSGGPSTATGQAHVGNERATENASSASKKRFEILEGKWRLLSSSEFQATGDSVNVVQLVDTIPAYYTVRVKVTRVSGKEQFTVSLPAGASRVTAAIDGYAGKISGLELVGGKHMHENATTVSSAMFRDGVEHEVEYRVQPGRIVVRFDGKDLIQWRGDFSLLSAPRRYEGSKPRRLLVITRANYIIRDLEISPIRVP